jgi:hypothetical protein
VRALWSARTSPHHLHHLVGACAMVYMAVAMAASPGHHGHAGGSGIPLMTGALLLYFAGYVLRSGARLLPAAATAGGSGTLGGTPRALGWGDRPELSQACRLSMGIAMVAMLVTL